MGWRRQIKRRRGERTAWRTLTVSEDFAVDEDESEHDPQDPIQSSLLPFDVAQNRPLLFVLSSVPIGVPFAQNAPERFLLAAAEVVALILKNPVGIVGGEGEV